MSPQQHRRDVTSVTATCGHTFPVHAVGHTRTGQAQATCPSCGVSAAVTTIEPQEG